MKAITLLIGILIGLTGCGNSSSTGGNNNNSGLSNQGALAYYSNFYYQTYKKEDCGDTSRACYRILSAYVQLCDENGIRTGTSATIQLKIFSGYFEANIYYYEGYSKLVTGVPELTGTLLKLPGLGALSPVTIDGRPTVLLTAEADTKIPGFKNFTRPLWISFGAL